MIENWLLGPQNFLKTLSQILTAGVSITAFSLLVYALTFNLRDRVARYFAMIMVCVVIVFTAEAIGSTTDSMWSIGFWLRVQWVGIVFLPAIYLHFSDALLETTGKPSRGRRRWAVRLTYLGSAVFMLALPFSWLIVPTEPGVSPAPHLRPTLLTDFFVVFYFSVMIVSWVNFIRAYRRCGTTASRRRMVYLLTGALAPAVGSFPFLPYSSPFLAMHPLIFWTTAVISNVLAGVLIVVMAYSVAFFGVAWADRVVKARLFKWIMRGPFTASLTLAAVTLVRRGSEAFGSSYSAPVPIVMVVTILVCEHFITLFGPAAERLLFYGNERKELEALHNLEEQLVTRNDLTQFLEMVLAAVIDRLQADGAYVIALNPASSELVISMGKTRFSDRVDETTLPQELILKTVQGGAGQDLFEWENDLLIPLMNGTAERPEMLGLLGVSGVTREMLDQDQILALSVLTGRAVLALRDRRVQQQVFQSLEQLSPQVDLLQRLRAAGRYDQEGILTNEDGLPENDDLTFWVKEALTHYWGGPKLTSSPLLKFQVVREAAKEFEGNQSNALRAILRRAIDQVKPEGERRFTGEWILYNILEMKFLEGKKVREIARRLALSDADLYRKQRVALKTVARAVADMEAQARKDADGSSGGKP